MARGRKLTKDDFNMIKYICDQHRTLTSEKIGKLSGFSRATVNITRMSKDLDQYKEIKQKYMHNEKKKHDNNISEGSNGDLSITIPLHKIISILETIPILMKALKEFYDALPEIPEETC